VAAGEDVASNQPSSVCSESISMTRPRRESQVPSVSIGSMSASRSCAGERMLLVGGLELVLAVSSGRRRGSW